MPSLLPRSKRLRSALLVGASIVVVVVVALLLANTADNGSKHQAAKAKAKAKAAAKLKPLKLVIGPVIVQSTGLPSKVGPPVRRAVMRSTQRYFDDAIQAPLMHHPVNSGYSQIFAADVRGLALHRDRAALTESATGPIRGRVLMSASRVRVDGLGDPAGKLALVATTFKLNAEAKTPAGKLMIRRQAELTFAYEGGAWRVIAYQVTVRRTLGPRTTTTTARAGTGTKP